MRCAPSGYRRPKFARLAQISGYFTAEAMRTQRHTCPRQHLKRTPTWSNVVRTKITNGVTTPALLTSRRWIYDSGSELLFAIAFFGRSGGLCASGEKASRGARSERL